MLDDYPRELSKLEQKLLALLDRIEVEGDASLAGQRHDIAEEFGYTVEITAEHASGEVH